MESSAGEIEKHVYKEYRDSKGNDKQLNIALVRPVDNLKHKKRPLIIGIHGSGFINTCLFDPCYVKYSREVLARHFVPQGFITASVKYRLASPLDLQPPRISDNKLKETHYNAVQDVREAIKFIFENAEKFGVDTENVFIIGTSAGAITALHAAYLDNDEVSENLLKVQGRLAEREKIKGVISLSGAIYDLSYLKGGDKIPLMIVHGSKDFIVPAAKGFYLGMKHITPVFGGKTIFEEAQKQEIPAKGYFYDFGHKYPSRFENEIYKNTNDFIRSHITCLNQNPENIK
ncbi:MAG: alpha/beta hydrolase [Aridibacter sp.]